MSILRSRLRLTLAMTGNVVMQKPYMARNLPSLIICSYQQLGAGAKVELNVYCRIDHDPVLFTCRVYLSWMYSDFGFCGCGFAALDVFS